MSYIPERFPRYHGYVLPPFPNLLADVDGHMDKIRNFDSRESDIMICTYPKSGTNWINELIYMMMKKKAEYQETYKLTAMLEALPDFKSLEQIPEDSVRIINSHIPLKDLPQKHIQNGYKVVLMSRNPKDMAVSLYHHVSKVKMLQGTDGNIEYPKSWDNLIQHYCRGPELYSGWFNYEKEFEEAKLKGTLKNVFSLHYEHLKQNPLPILKDLAKFLGVNLSDELLEEINTKCSFEQMSSSGKQAKDNTFFKDNAVDGKTWLFRKGNVGDWKNWFTVAQNEAFDELIASEMKDSRLKFIYEL